MDLSGNAVTPETGRCPRVSETRMRFSRRIQTRETGNWLQSGRRGVNVTGASRPF